MSPEEVAQAVALHNDGRSIRYIANLLGIPRSTVSDAIQRFRETGSYARKPGQGRRRVTNAVEDQMQWKTDFFDYKVCENGRFLQQL
jgi:transposase